MTAKVIIAMPGVRRPGAQRRLSDDDGDAAPGSTMPASMTKTSTSECTSLDTSEPVERPRNSEHDRGVQDGVIRRRVKVDKPVSRTDDERDDQSEHGDEEVAVGHPSVR